MISYPYLILSQLGLFNGCVMWRQTGNCTHKGVREPNLDKTCDQTIHDESGYCECSDGHTAMSKGCYGRSKYGYAYSTCQVACKMKGICNLADILSLHMLT